MSNQFRLLLFIVVISGALCTVEDYVIMSQCAHNKAIHVAAEGTVSVTDISQTQNITIVGLPDYVNNNLKIALYAKETQRYVCFNDQWKLVGMKELRDTCYFNETIVHGYFVFRSVVDLQRRVGFTHRGKAVGPKKNVNDACYLFTKIQADQFFHQHTDYFAPKAKSTKIISGIRTSPQLTATTTYTTSGASARLSSQRAALSAAATTATATATAVAQRSHNNKLLRNNNKNKRVNGGRSNSSNNNSNNINRKSNNNQNEEYTNGHSSNLSSSSNSSNNNHNNSNLVSNSQEQVGLSQQKHHNSNSNSRTREHVRQQQQQQQQQQHQVRHHHNDPNLIARRQQHEHKQKRRQNQRQQQRLRSGKSTSPATTSETEKAASKVASINPTEATLSATARGETFSSSYKPGKNVLHMPEPATVADFATKAATATTIIMKATTIANKRKGRRRKARKQRKQQQLAQLAQLQKLEQEMLPPTNRQLTQAAVSPTQTTVDRLWSDSPAPSVSSLSTLASGEVTSSISSATTDGDYSGEWLSSVAVFAESTAEFSSTSTLSSAASGKPTQTYTVNPLSALTTDSNETSTLVAPTSDYTNITAFTSETFADEETLNATLTSEVDDSEMLPAPTSVAGLQLNSITSEQRSTTQDGRILMTDAEIVAPTSTTWSESDSYSWSPSAVAARATTANETDAEAMFAAPTAAMETENVAATVVFPEDVNATAETQPSSDDNEFFAAINTTSSEADMGNSSSRSDDYTEPLVDAESTLSTIVPQRNGDNFTINRMWKTQSGIAASIATLLHNQLMTTSATNDEYAWRPRHEEEYSDEIVVATVRPTVAEADTSTDLAIGERATWWQQHMNHSGKNFWDKGLADEVIGNLSADFGWFKHNNKHRNTSRRRHSSRNASNISDRVVETVSHQPMQALYSSEPSLGYNKKYSGEGKLQRPGPKAYTSTKLQVSAVAQEYSSTMPTTSRVVNERHRQYTISSPATTATSHKTTATTTTTTGQPYPLLQLLGNKTISPNPNQPQLLQFDGNSNHLAHTHTPTTTTLITSTTSLRPSSTTISSDVTTATAAAASTTRKSLRISMQKLLATPFHQLTYVRNNAGDIDIDNIDNISVYPDLLDESDELAEQHSTERAATDGSRNSRLTVVSGYLLTSTAVVLPESIRLAKVKINKERKRMMSLRKRHNRRYA